MASTTNIGFTLMEQAQAQKHVTFNEAMRIADALLQGRVINTTTSTPPGSPSEGDTYIVASSPTGDWTGAENWIATLFNGAWLLLEPKEGWLLFNQATSSYIRYNGTLWVNALSPVTSIYGWQNFQDTTTAGTPISLPVSTWTKLTNDDAGALSSQAYAVSGHGSLWNSTTNQLDFTSLSIGDVITLRLDYLVTTSGANHNISGRLAFGPGLAFQNIFQSQAFKSASSNQIFIEFSLAMFNTATRDNPAEIQVFADASGDSVVVNGWFIQTKVV